MDLIEAYVDLPPVALPDLELPNDLSDDDIVEAARLTREPGESNTAPYHQWFRRSRLTES